MHYTFFPEVFIQLQLEIQNRHPRLIQRLQKHPPGEVALVFAETCHYCGYGIDAEMDGEQLEALAEVLLRRLQEIRNPLEELKK